MKKLVALLLASLSLAVYAATNPNLPAGASYSHTVPSTYIVDQYQNVIGIQSGQGVDSYLGPSNQGSGLFYADATGTSDALIVSIPIVTQLTDGLTIGVGAAFQNLTSTPQLYLNKFSATTIVKGGGSSLNVGDIAGNQAQLVLQYNLQTNQWFLVNPATNFAGNNETFGQINMTSATGQNGIINTSLVVGDQFVTTADTSPFRRGASTLASGTAYTLCGSSLIMDYWSHNTVFTAVGGFGGTGDTGTSEFGCYTEADTYSVYHAPSVTAGTVPTFGATPAYQVVYSSGNAIYNGHLSVSGGATPTIASGACGATTNGTISGTDQNGKITIGSAATTACAVTFGSSTWLASPASCVFSPATAASAALTVLAYVSALSTSGFTITGSALATTSFYYHCQ